MCFGGSAPAAPPAPPPPPQLAQSPSAAAVRSNTATQNAARNGPGTLLTGGLGDSLQQANLDKKTLLGQ